MLTGDKKINLKNCINKKILENRDIIIPIYKLMIHIMNVFSVGGPGRKRL